MHQCDDDLGILTLDLDSSTYSPNPVVKGCNLEFNIVGKSTKPFNLKKLYYSIDWNGKFIYEDTDPILEDFNYEKSFNYTHFHYIPRIVPSGNYDVTVYGYQKNESKTLFCANLKIYLA